MPNHITTELVLFLVYRTAVLVTLFEFWISRFLLPSASKWVRLMVNGLLILLLNQLGFANHTTNADQLFLCKWHNLGRSTVSLKIKQPMQISCFFANQTTYADQLFLCKSHNLLRSAASLQITQPMQIRCLYANHTTYADQLFLCKSHNLPISAVCLQITQHTEIICFFANHTTYAD